MHTGVMASKWGRICIALSTAPKSEHDLALDGLTPAFSDKLIWGQFPNLSLCLRPWPHFSFSSPSGLIKFQSLGLSCFHGLEGSPRLQLSFCLGNVSQHFGFASSVRFLR